MLFIQEILGVWSLQPEQSSKDLKMKTNKLPTGITVQKRNWNWNLEPKTGTLTNRKRKVEIGEGENFWIANATDICQSRKPSQQVNNNLQIFSPNAESNPHDSPRIFDSICN